MKAGLPFGRVAFQLTVAAGGLAALAYAAATMAWRPQVVPLLLFVALSAILQRSGFHTTQKVTHCLVGMVDVAAVLIFGPLGGAVVSFLGGFVYLWLHALRGKARNWETLLLTPLFDGSLKAMMALGGGALYLHLGGDIPLLRPSWHDVPALAALFVAWFAVDHLAWGAVMTLSGGRAGLRTFVRDSLPVSVLVELLPLPMAVPIAVLYARGEMGLFAVVTAGVVAASITLQAFSDARLTRERRLRELTLLDRIGWDFARASLNVDELCELIYRYCSELVDTSHTFMLGIADPQNQRIRHAIMVENGQRLSPNEIPYTPGIRYLQEHRQPLLIRDMEREALPFTPTVIGQATRSVILVPLVADHDLIGVLSVQHADPNVYTEDDLRILSALAAQGALAIRKAQSYEAEQRRSRQLAAIARVTQQVAVLRDLTTLFNLVVDVIRETFGYYYVALFTVDPRTGKLDFQAASSESGRTCYFQVELGQGITGYVAETGQPVLANDVTQEPRYRPVDHLEETRSELTVPLLLEGRILGVLDVQSDRRNAFTQDDLATMQTVATQVAVAIHEARLYDRERKRARQLAAVSEVGRKIVSILNLDAMLDEVVNLVSEQFNYPHVHVFTVDGAQREVVYRAGTAPADSVSAQLRFGLDAEGIVPWVARTGEPLVVNDVQADPRYRPGPSIGDVRSELAMPLRFGKQILGVFDLQSQEPNAFDAEDLPVLQALADQIAVAVRNATLFAAQQEEAWVSTVLLQVAEAVGQQTSVEGAISAVVDIVPLLVGVNRCTIFLLDRATGEFCTDEGYSTARGAAPRVGALCLRPADVPLLARIVASKSPVIVPDEEITAWVPADLVRAYGIRHLAAFPLVARGEVRGCMAVEFADAAWPPASKALAIVSGVANQTATAIESAQLYDALQEEAYVSNALLQVAESINAAVDLDEALGAVVRITPILVGVDRCMILLWDERRQQFLPAKQYGVDRKLEADFAGLAFRADEFPLLGELAHRKEPLIVANVAESDLVPKDLAEKFGIRSLLALPLQTKGDILGAMLVDFQGLEHRFPENRMALLTGIASQTAMAVENYRLSQEMAERQRLEQELEVARSIQKSFLPSSCPFLPGWEVAALWRSARRVGGDFYDIILFDERRVGFVVADVSDKGVPAALYMALSKTIIRASALERRSPAEALRRANDLLVADSSSGMFVTVFYGVLDVREGVFTYANAGHNPPLLARVGGQTPEYLSADGMILGVMEDVALEEKQTRMNAGDVLLMYTDGLTDAINEREEEFGTERLARCLVDAMSQTAEALIQHIDREVAAHVNGQPQFDDYTLLAVKRAAPEEPMPATSRPQP
ncbi:MAG: GAF domain-containing protein [Chloroflexi bacterium]|nr:GAF domain-containing protein [Chloroflexota bacterium]